MKYSKSLVASHILANAKSYSVEVVKFAELVKASQDLKSKIDNTPEAVQRDFNIIASKQWHAIKKVKQAKLQATIAKLSTIDSKQAEALGIDLKDLLELVN